MDALRARNDCSPIETAACLGGLLELEAGAREGKRGQVSESDERVLNGGLLPPPPLSFLLRLHAQSLIATTAQGQLVYIQSWNGRRGWVSLGCGNPSGQNGQNSMPAFRQEGGLKQISILISSYVTPQEKNAMDRSGS